MTDTIKCPKRGGIECETSIACADGCLYDNDPIHPNRIGDRTAPAKEARNEPLVAEPWNQRGKLTLTEWLEERADNCARIYRLKDDGADKALWREDEAYFREAVRLLKKGTENG